MPLEQPKKLVDQETQIDAYEFLEAILKRAFLEAPVLSVAQAIAGATDGKERVAACLQTLLEQKRDLTFGEMIFALQKLGTDYQEAAVVALTQLVGMWGKYFTNRTPLDLQSLRETIFVCPFTRPTMGAGVVVCCTFEDKKYVLVIRNRVRGGKLWEMPAGFFDPLPSAGVGNQPWFYPKDVIDELEIATNKALSGGDLAPKDRLQAVLEARSAVLVKHGIKEKKIIAFVGHASLPACAAAELLQETGLKVADLSLLKFIPILGEELRPSRLTHSFGGYYYLDLAGVDNLPTLAPEDAEEVCEARWIPVSEIVVSPTSPQQFEFQDRGLEPVFSGVARYALNMIYDEEIVKSTGGFTESLAQLQAQAKIFGVEIPRVEHDQELEQFAKARGWHRDFFATFGKEAQLAFQNSLEAAGVLKSAAAGFKAAQAKRFETAVEEPKSAPTP